MSLDGFLEPCSSTAVVIPLSDNTRSQLADLKKGDLVLFSASRLNGEDNHLAARVLTIGPEGIIASAAAYIGAFCPGPEPAPVERRYGLRTFQSTPSGPVYVNNGALDVLGGQPGTRPYAGVLRRSLAKTS